MNPEQLQEFFNQLPPEIQQKVMALPTEQERMAVVAKLFERYQMQQGQREAPVDPTQMMSTPPQYEEAPMAMYGYRAQQGLNTRQRVPVEAERNENITVPEGETTPQTSGGYLKHKSYNPVSGQSTYEIPDEGINNTHEDTDRYTGESGVNMQLAEGSVVNSDKTKIPFDFKIGKSNYRGKTFKEASDKISRLEKKANDKLRILKEAGESDDITETSFAMNFAKYAKLRDELNRFQETVLDLKKQTESNQTTDSLVARYGKTMGKYQKAQYGLSVAMDNYIENKPGFKNGTQVLKAAKGLEATIASMDNLMADMKSENLDIDELTSRAKSYGLMDEAHNPKESAAFMYNPTVPKIQQFKDGIAGIESLGTRNPYEAHNKHTSEGTWGKYQFVWSLWKNKIAKQTGIKTPQEWIKNPAAQEKFMDWYTQTELMPTAVKLKQELQLPFNLYQIMAGIHLEGEKNFIKKYKANQLSESTMAGNFKNMSTKDYIARFADFDDEEQPQEEMRYGGYTATTKIPKYTFQESFRIEDDNNKYFPKKKYMYGDTIEASGGVNIPFTLWQGDVKPPNKPRLNLPTYTIEDLDWINQNVFQGAAKNNADIQKMIFNEYQNITGMPPQRFYKGQFTGELAKEDAILGDDLSTPIEVIKRYYQNNPSSTNQISVITPKETITEPLPQSSPEESLSQKNNWFLDKSGKTPRPLSADSQTQTTEEEIQEDEKTPWWKKAQYYTNQMLPGIDALALMMERPIPPTLQQKDARYTPLRTDVDINPQLNQADRMYATVQADMRGNPSQRAARLSQVASNLTDSKNQVLANKYNMENQLYNQEVMRRDQYFNQLDDVNRQLMKQYEVERLQTEENLRQQRNQARQFLMNMPIRKAEQDKALALATMNSVYDYDPITGKFTINKERAEQENLLKLQQTKLKYILDQKEDFQQQLKDLKAKGADVSAIKEQIALLQAQEEELTGKTSKSRYGGQITSKSQKVKDAKIQSNLSPGMSYRKYFPVF